VVFFFFFFFFFFVKSGCDQVIASTRITGEDFTTSMITFSNFNVTLPAGASVRSIDLDVRRAAAPSQFRGTVVDDDILVNGESLGDVDFVRWVNFSETLRFAPLPSPQSLRHLAHCQRGPCRER
jgi:hypothetical protein